LPIIVQAAFFQVLGPPVGDGAYAFVQRIQQLGGGPAQGGNEYVVHDLHGPNLPGLGLDECVQGACYFVVHVRSLVDFQERRS